MQLDEATEKAFKAGYDYALDNAYGGEFDDGVFISKTYQEGYIDYINGNDKSNTNKIVLEQG
jgi:hypothetical protein